MNVGCSKLVLIRLRNKFLERGGPCHGTLIWFHGSKYPTTLDFPVILARRLVQLHANPESLGERLDGTNKPDGRRGAALRGNAITHLELGRGVSIRVVVRWGSSLFLRLAKGREASVTTHIRCGNWLFLLLK